MKTYLLKFYFSIFWYFAKRYYKKYSPVVIWVTWSIWKTTARVIISQIISKNLDKKVYSSSKNYNWELWLSLSILWIDDYEPNFKSILKTIFRSFCISFFSEKKYDIMVLEYWIDHIWEMDFMLSIVKPDFWIITKVDLVHSSQFKNKETIASQKYKLAINSQKWAYLNYDDEFLNVYKNKISAQKNIYSTNIDIDNKFLDIYSSDFILNLEDELPVSNFNIHSKAWKLNIKSNLIWTENVGYISIWYDILEKLNNIFYSKSFFKENIDNLIKLDLELMYSRFNIFSWINNSILIDSTYNSSPLSMRKVIENTISLKNILYSDYSLILCLWEMRELWDYSQNEHELLAEFVKDKSSDIFVVWNNMKEYFLPKSKELDLNVKYFKNSFLLWNDLKTFLEINDKKYILLFKWWQNTIYMEEALKAVLKDKSDIKNICRQEDFWIKVKQKFFELK